MLKAKKSGALYALDNIDHDGVRYSPGDELPPLTPDVEARLRAGGVISAVAPVEDAPVDPTEG
jgi:hypothetical protein